MDHERMDDAPKWLKWTLTIYNRAGFPTLAFLLICYICFITLHGQTDAIQEFKVVMMQMTNSIQRNTESVDKMTQALYKTR